MATVTKQFRDDFEAWAANRVAAGWFSAEDVEDIRELVRRDLTPGPDLLRAGAVVSAGGVPTSAAIDDHEERYRLWVEYLAEEARPSARRQTSQLLGGLQPARADVRSIKTALGNPIPPQSKNSPPALLQGLHTLSHRKR